MAKKLNDGHYFELLDRIHVMAQVLDDHCRLHPVSVKEKQISSALDNALAELAEAYQRVGNLVGGKKVKGQPRKTEFTKLQEKVIDRLNSVPYSNGDISDLGNEIGYALCKELSNRQALTDFLHGLNHGISLFEHSKKPKKKSK